MKKVIQGTVLISCLWGCAQPLQVKPVVSPPDQIKSDLKEGALSTTQGVQVSTFVGQKKFGYQDGDISEALFYHPAGVVFDAAQNLYVVDRLNYRVRKITPSGEVSSVAGNGKRGNIDGPLDTARLNDSVSVLFPAKEGLMVVDSPNHSIRQVTETEMTTILGKGVPGFEDGDKSQAKLNWPSGMVQDSKGNFFISERKSHRIRKLSPDGQVSTFAGSGLVGFADGQGKSALFDEPMAIAIDGKDNLYIADSQNNRIRQITPEGLVSTLAGSGQKGSRDDQGALAEFRTPSGIAVAPSGNVYVSDRFNHRIRQITPEGLVTTLAGNGEAAYKDGNAKEASFSYPFGIALSDAGDLYIADHGNHSIRRIKLDSP